jgi:kynureninase
MELPSRVGGRIAPLIGATTGEVVCADSTSINVFKLLAAALKLNPDRSTILSDSGNFPTDLYMAQGLGELIGGARRLRVVDEETLVDSIDENTAVVMATHVNYRTGRRHDMQAVTRRAHELGALMLWDLAHSAGAMPIELDAVRADFAVGCGYKYLNGGPGAPAFLYVAERHLDSVRPPLSGWLGHEAPFAFDLEYRPASGIERNRVGTPAILNMAALDAALDVFDGVDMKQVREKSVALAEYFIELVEERCGEFSVELVSPRNASARGSQVSFRHPQAYAVMQALIERGFIGDFRAPDVLRFGFAPLYVRYVDAWDTAAALRDILETGAWDQEKFRVKSRVT